jgi:glycerophosphoryl diester phosphodiesterase
VPILSEALHRYPSTRFSIDAKSDDPALVEALVKVVRGSGALERVCLGSFHDAQADLIGRLLPDVARHLPQGAATCHVMAAKSGEPFEHCPRGYDVASLPHRLEGMTVVDRAVVDHFHRLGVPVHVWTVDEESDMRALIALGVDGIVSNRPDLLGKVLGRARPSA